LRCLPGLHASPAEAAEAFRARRVAVLTCLTSAYVELRGYAPAPSPHPFALAKGEAVRLRGESQLGLTVAEEYELIEADQGEWETRVVSYFYGFEHAGSKLLAYHWHPQGHSPVTEPHLHVMGEREFEGQSIGKLHLPTGAIRLEDIVALAIEELGAEPLREDWRTVLAA
jgi:hypothetical protein